MNVLVIGGAGYIGSHVVNALLERGDSVTIFDNMSTGQEINLFENANFIKGDILNYEELSNAMSHGFDGLIHLAAFKAAGESMVAPEKYSVNNITGTINIINGAVEHGIQNFVFSSSAAVYGEPQYTPLDEKHPLNPENYYGFTKLEVERILHWYSKIKGINYASLRYFNAAGYNTEGKVKGLEQNPANLLPIVMEVAAGIRDELHIYGNDYETRDGTCVRDYIHVGDLARAHLKGLDYINDKKENLTVNLGSETGVTVSEMVAKAREITGKEIPARFVDRRAGDPAVVLATAVYAKEILQWEAVESDVDTLIRSTWELYKKL